MRLFRMAALAVALVGGYLGLASAPASAAPASQGVVHATEALATAEYTQYYGRRGYYGRRAYYGRPVFYGRPAYRRVVVRRPAYYARPVYYRRPVVVRRAYGSRVVCRVRPRLVATPYGYVRRPVRVCTRRF